MVKAVRQRPKLNLILSTGDPLAPLFPFSVYNGGESGLYAGEREVVDSNPRVGSVMSLLGLMPQ